MVQDYPKTRIFLEISVVFLTLLSLAFNLARNILEKAGLAEYLIFALSYFLLALLIWGVVRRKSFAYLLAGIWTALSAFYLIFMWGISGSFVVSLITFLQFLLVAGISISAFFLAVVQMKRN